MATGACGLLAGPAHRGKAEGRRQQEEGGSIIVFPFFMRFSFFGWIKCN
jgi:hypothetical protein